MKLRLFLAAAFSVSALGFVIGCMDVPPTGQLNDYCGVEHPDPGMIDGTASTVLPNGAIAMSQTTPFTPQPANYNFNFANIYYNDTYNQLHLYFNVTRASTGNLTGSLICMSGTGQVPGMKSFNSVPAPFVSGMTYDGKTLQVQQQSLTFQFGTPPPPKTLPYLRNITVNSITTANAISSTFNVFSGFTEIQQTFNQIAPANQNNYILWVTANCPAPGQDSTGTGLNLKELIYLTAASNTAAAN